MKVILKMFATSTSAKCLVMGLAGGILLLAMATGANAQEVFRWVDKAGKVHYGDIPPPPAEVKTVQTKKLSDSVIESRMQAHIEQGEFELSHKLHACLKILGRDHFVE